MISFLKACDSTGKALFSLGKTVADALAAPGSGHDKYNAVAASLRNAYLSSGLSLSKVMHNIAEQVLNELHQSSADSAQQPEPQTAPRPNNKPENAPQQEAHQQTPPPRPDKTPPQPNQKPDTKTSTNASAKVSSDHKAEPTVKPLYELLDIKDKRRSQRHRLNWERMTALARLFIPYPRELTMHPYPLTRFGVKTQGRSRMR